MRWCSLFCRYSCTGNRRLCGSDKKIHLQQVEPAKQAKVIRDFQKQSAQMDMSTEMMSDAIDDALDNNEAEELTNQVLDEIGVDVASWLSAAPKGRVATKNTENASSSGIDDLEKHLAAPRKP